MPAEQRLSVPKILERIQTRIFGRQIHGQPVSRERWEREFAEGSWDRLGSIDEMGHYFVIFGYLHFLPRSDSGTLSILDVGCGNGQLYKYITAILPRCRYTGIDLSQAAIAQCKAIAREGSQFRVCDFDHFETSGSFDAIVFNESLYYAYDPGKTISRYRAMLSRSGRMILSVYRYRHHAEIVADVLKEMECEHTTMVSNGKGQEWDVFLLH